MSTIVRPKRWQQDTSGQHPRRLLMQLTQRTSGKGNAYLTGWLGEARLVGFKGEPDEYGNERWDIYAAEPEPRPSNRGRQTRAHESGPASREVTRAAPARHPADNYGPVQLSRARAMEASPS